MVGMADVLGACWWNSWTFFLAFCMFLAGTHEFSSLRNPAHFTKYWSFPCCTLESNTFSTSYSSPSFVMIGGGGIGCCCSVDVDGHAGLKRTVLKTGWIHFHVGGSCSLYAYSPTFAAMQKGPYCLSSSFFDGQSVEMCEPSRYTWSPISYSGASCLPLL